jgi:steroid delta-isomerase-like uncharacterized protein
MSIESTSETMRRYWEDDDLSAIAEDAVYTETWSGRQWVGREKVSELLDWFYGRTLDVTPEAVNRIVGDGQAAVEVRLKGRHIGEFEGIPATNREIDVPLCVVYDLENDQIKRARIYLQVLPLLQQIGALPAGQATPGR